MPAIEDLAKNTNSTAPPDLASYYKAQGLVADQSGQQEPIKFPEAAQLINPSRDGGSIEIGKDVTDAAVGSAKGLATNVQRIYNAGLDAVNSVARAADITGKSTGDLISPDAHMDWSALTPKPSDPTVEKVFRGITEYAAPVAAAMMSGTGEIAALAVGAGIDYSTLDPHQERLTGMVADKYPELRNMAIIGNAVNWMSDNKNESAAEGRFKNMLEGLGIGGAMAGAFRGTQKVSQLTKQYLEARQAAKQAVGGAKQAAQGVAQVVADGSALPIRNGSMMLSDQAIVQGPNGPMPNMNHGDMNKFLSQYSSKYEKGAGFQDLKYQKRTGESVHADAQRIMNDPKAMDDLMNWKAGDRPLTNGEIEVAKHLKQNALDHVFSLGDKVTADPSQENMAALADAMHNYQMMEGIRGGSASTQGADLSQQSLLKEFMGGKKLSTMLEAETAENKSALINQLEQDSIKMSGGPENVKDLAQKISAINKLNPEQAKAAVAKAARMSQGSWKKMGDSVTFAAINFMLSSPKTFVKVLFSQGGTVGMSIMDHLVAGALPEFLGGSSEHTLRDGLNFSKGQMDAFMEHLASVGRALKLQNMPEASNVAQYRIKFNSFNPISSENYGIDSTKLLGRIVDRVGQATAIPSKLVGFHDNFYGQAVYRGILNQYAERAAQQAGHTGEDYAKFVQEFLHDPTVEAHEAGVKAAQEYTMMGPFAKNKMGQVGQGLHDFMNDKIPMGNIISPFMKVGFNLADYTYQHSPFKALSFLSPTIRAELRGNPAERAMAIAKIANGSMMLGAATYLASQGVITGEAPKNYAVGKALEESHQGWQPDSIKVGNSYVSVKGLEPFVSYMRMGALFSELHKYTTKQEFQQLAALGGGILAESFTPEMLVEHNSNILDAAMGIIDPEKMGHATSNFTADMISRFTPNIVKDVRNVTDPYRGDTNPGTGHGGLGYAYEKIKSVVSNRVPGLSKDNPIDRNIFGEPLLVPSYMPKDDFATWQERALSMVSPFAVSSGKNSEEVQALKLLGKYYEEHQPMNSELNALQVSKPSRTFSMNRGAVRIPLNPKEYERLVMYTAGKDPDTGETLPGVQDLRSIVRQQVLPFYERLQKGTITPMEYNSTVGHLNKLFTSVKQEGKSRLAQDPMFNQKVRDAVQQAGTKQVNVFD